MDWLFTNLTHAIEGTPAVALVAAVAWGILSILLSPCHLGSIPLIVGFIDKQGQMATRRALLISGLFAVGILATIAAIGAVTAAAGRMMGDVGHWGNWLVACVFFIVGLHLLDVIPMPFAGPGQVDPVILETAKDAFPGHEALMARQFLARGVIEDLRRD